MKTFLNEYKGKEIQFRRIQFGLMSWPEQVEESCPFLMQAARKLWAWKQKHALRQESFDVFFQTLTLRKLLCLLAGCHLDVLADIFGLLDTDEPPEEAADSGSARIELFQQMYRHGMITSMIGEECVTGIRLYFQIRHERNAVSHGGEGSGKSIEDIEAMMEEMLSWLQHEGVEWAVMERSGSDAAICCQ